MKPRRFHSLTEMDWLTFISNMTGALAWPSAAAAIALIFRSQIQNLVKNLSRLKWGEVEAQFGQKVESIREEAKSFENDPDYEDQPIERKLVELVESHPHLAVAEGWKGLERSITNLAVNRLGADRSQSISSLIDALARSTLVPPAMITTIANIREVRNRAVHEINADVSSGTAYVLLDTQPISTK
jgi:hypothetical protein